MSVVYVCVYICLLVLTWLMCLLWLTKLRPLMTSIKHTILGILCCLRLIRSRKTIVTQSVKWEKFLGKRIKASKYLDKNSLKATNTLLSHQFAPTRQSLNVFFELSFEVLDSPLLICFALLFVVEKLLNVCWRHLKRSIFKLREREKFKIQWKRFENLKKP